MADVRLEQMSDILVSVILPTYNGEDHIEETIDSVLNQSESPAFELIVSDDGSSDETVDIVRSYTDDRVTLVCSDENRGIAVNTNTAVEQASGEYIAFIDQDDRWHESKLREHVDAHEATESTLVFSDVAFIDSVGNNQSSTELPDPESVGQELVEQLFTHNNFIPTLSCVSVARNAWVDVGGFDTQLERSCDFDLYIRLAENYSFDRIAQTLVEKRQHDSYSDDFRKLHTDQQRIVSKMREQIDDDIIARYLAEIHRSRASHELQSGNGQSALRFCRRSLKHSVQSKAAALTILATLEIITWRLHLGQRLHALYLARSE